MPTVTVPPANLSSGGYYTKYIDAGGIPILGAPGTSDAALVKLWELTMNMTARLSPAVVTAIRNGGAEFATFPIDVKLTDLPEYRYLRGVQIPDGRFWDDIRGIGGNTVATGEEIVLDLPGNPYPADENIALHEFAHNIFEIGVKTANSVLYSQTSSAYSAALGAGKWAGTYAGSNAAEYRAVATQALFDQASQFMPDSNAGINNRAELQAFDPTIFNILTQIFTLDTWRPGQFYGNDDDNTFNLTPNRDFVFGGGGNDRFVASAGADVLEGGAGLDTVDFSSSPAALVANLTAQTMSGGHADGDTFTAIESLVGTPFADSLFGDANPNALDGGPGADQMAGTGGDDTLSDGGGDAPGVRDVMYGGPGNDTYHVHSTLASALDIVDEGAANADLAGLPSDVDTIVSHGEFFWDFYSAGEVLRIAADANTAFPGGTHLVGGSSAGPTQIFGNDGANLISVYGGTNRVDAGGGTDAISFSLYDLAEGFDGVNTLAMRPGSGIDYLYDFESGVDRVDLTGFGFGIGGQAVLDQGIDANAGGTPYCYFFLTDAGGVNNFVAFVGLTTAQLHAADFLTGVA